MKKTSKKFDYCPHCGNSFRRQREQDDFGMLGKNDFLENTQQPIKMPLGLNKIMDSLIKQLGKQFSELDNMNNPEQNFNNQRPNSPRGFKIQISTGKPPRIEQMNNKNMDPSIMQKDDSKKIKTPKIEQIRPEKVSNKEQKRRKSLPIKDAESMVRRLSDRIVYEILVPGVSAKKEVTITKLEDGIEIRAYSKSACFFKALQIKAEILKYYLEKGRLFLELKD